MKQVDINQATHDELLEYGRNTLGLSLQPNTGLEKLRAKIMEASDKAYITIAEPEVPAAQVGDEPRPVETQQAAPGRNMVRINIAVQEDAGGKDPVPVGVNGKIMIIPRGEDVDIPEEYFEALSHAVSHKFDPNEDGDGLNPIPRKVSLYPHQVLGRFTKPAAQA